MTFCCMLEYYALRHIFNSEGKLYCGAAAGLDYHCKTSALDNNNTATHINIIVNNYTIMRCHLSTSGCWCHIILSSLIISWGDLNHRGILQANETPYQQLYNYVDQHLAKMSSNIIRLYAFISLTDHNHKALFR